MKVALYDVDSRIPNLVLMKLARHHGERGDNVEMFFPLSNGQPVTPQGIAFPAGVGRSL